MVAAQQVRVGPRVHGRLVLVTDRPLTPVDHLLLGNAASLIALEAEKPSRLRDEQGRVNSLFLRMLLDGSLPPAAAADHLTEAGFPVRDGVRVPAVRGGNPRRALELAEEELARCGLPLFGAVHEGSAVVLLPGGQVLRQAATPTQPGSPLYHPTARDHREEGHGRRRCPCPRPGRAESTVAALHDLHGDAGCFPGPSMEVGAAVALVRPHVL
ncbi:hypothetical protein GCM10010306_098850 [Streptomyces umbrinus]|nr:hypothetical protein GCM10010306_098850 [Streptomyces umbrinus]